MFEKLKGRTPHYVDYELYGQYAVLAPFLPKTKEFLFEVRSTSLKNQPGEICFPGGKIEVDETPDQAAVRETTEELLLPRDNIELIAPLDIFMLPYHLTVHPFLATINNYQGTFQSDEVAEVFTVPFDFFLNSNPAVYQNTVSVSASKDFPYELLGITDYPWRTSSYPVLFYQYKNRVIWGMTARFMSNIVELYKKTT